MIIDFHQNDYITNLEFNRKKNRNKNNTNEINIMRYDLMLTLMFLLHGTLRMGVYSIRRT